MKQSILVRAMEETERESKERMDSQRGQGETKHFGKSYGGDRERERVKKEWPVKEVRVKQSILVRTMEETERERE